MEYSGEIIRENIRTVTNKGILTFDELSDIIVRFFGTETENGTMVMNKEEMEAIIRNILKDEISFTALVAMQNSHELQSILIWEYNVREGTGFLRKK